MTPEMLAEFKQTAVARTLRRCALFADLPSDTVNEVAALALRKSLAKGEYLFLEGAPVDGFFVVTQGAIKLHRLNLKGHEQVFHVFRPTETLGEEMILSETGYPADATATEDTQYLLVPRLEFLALLNSEPELMLRVLRSAGERVRSLMGLLDDLTLKDATTRLAHWLVRQCAHPESREPQRIHLQMTKHLLAQELGVASETLSRTLHKLRLQHLVQVDGRAVTLLCPVRLAEFARQKVEFPGATATSSS